MSQDKLERHNVFHFSINKWNLGFGFMIDMKPPYAARELALCVEVKFVWLRFWWIRYKKGK